MRATNLLDQLRSLLESSDVEPRRRMAVLAHLGEMPREEQKVLLHDLKAMVEDSETLVDALPDAPRRVELREAASPGRSRTMIFAYQENHDESLAAHGAARAFDGAG